MSYILDALRKSDQQRRRGAAPALLPAQAEAAAPKRPAALIYAALALILLGAGVAIGWLRPWQPAPAGPAPIAAAVKPSVPVQVAPPPEPAIVPSAQPKLQMQNAAPPAVSTQAAAAAAPTSVPEEQDEEVRRPRRGAAPRTAAAPKSPAPPVPTAPTATATGTTAQASTIAAMKDLPVAVQQELPPMSISIHAYSRVVAERLVGINNRLLHEGDEVAPGLRLEQITPDGMVLSFKGYSFRRGVR